MPVRQAPEGGRDWQDPKEEMRDYLQNLEHELASARAEIQRLRKSQELLRRQLNTEREQHRADYDTATVLSRELSEVKRELAALRATVGRGLPRPEHIERTDRRNVG